MSLASTCDHLTLPPQGMSSTYCSSFCRIIYQSLQPVARSTLFLGFDKILHSHHPGNLLNIPGKLWMERDRVNYWPFPPLLCIEHLALVPAIVVHLVGSHLCFGVDRTVRFTRCLWSSSFLGFKLNIGGPSVT